MLRKFVLALSEHQETKSDEFPEIWWIFFEVFGHSKVIPHTYRYLYRLPVCPWTHTTALINFWIRHGDWTAPMPYLSRKIVDR